MKTTDIEIVIAILFVSLMLALIGVFMFVMVIFHQKRKIKNIEDKQRIIAQYEQEVLKAKVEMREETLKYVGQELHDNVGQVLSLIKLYLSQPTIVQKTDVKELINQAITDIRLLSHNLNINRVEQYSLSEFIKQELSKVNKAGVIKTSFTDQGFCEPINVQNRLMISRIFQECISNILKHAEANHIFVKLIAEDGICTLIVADDGIGFEAGIIHTGAGHTNIYDRARLIRSTVEITSSPGTGTKIRLRFPLN